MILTIENMKKVYKTHFRSFLALDDINFEIEEGQIWGLLGNNGAGKTTLIKSIIGGLNFEGTILIDGHKNNTSHAKEIISYIPEKATFPLGYNVKQYLMEVALLSKLDKKIAIKRIEHYLEYLEIKDLIKKKPRKLSSGQQKKVILIQALLSNPKLIIMDEPVANLDPETRYKYFKMLKKINKDYSISILISSHILAELDNFVDGVIILKKGKLITQKLIKKEQRISELYNKELGIKEVNLTYE
ncbi:ATP-binding cassette domain-containing protein [Mycoplasma marinum]|uniref:Multidrug ABC transporter ATP-binding protein n=1 Tax=Mycoplasma marinum TaxID=1937190 RepID=A0A4R0XMW6_9MOLU|nr:ABC transporter ATP-binding protein [Mycoplasma marinum]TCG11890.1 multidrug ABC transporter ATP-binding protein [Mycoplasma marinum]